ncbi:CRISPR-associated protein Cas6 [Caldicellulosiruptor owensensis OL]|uniref:CRISPR-associated endoribonuclease n=1 Tax=Caldicellulosiruptor owensensis (strain ATCC 700167 / DSM 13100 / OL) TaxID=632518 RepID=E4Q731_CALOW|nr:CRISPR-associated endoribonuclease Cas6 [Caldicellulosiruptor owensensis]ADQ05711.1 CRISPR-associated protein Cas6 [Caldicellulosiruptor owensensis OL]
MRYKLRFYTEQDVLLRFDYNLELSMVIKNFLNPKYVEFLENGGFKCDNKIFKPYTFSRLLPEQYQINSYGIEIKKGYVELIISSIDENFWFSFLEGLLKEKKISLSGREFYLESISVKRLGKKKKIIAQTYSPFIVKTIFKNWSFIEVERNLKKNLMCKVYVFKRKKYNEEDFNLKLFEKTLKKTIIVINNTPSEAYSGLLLIEGDEDIIETAYDAGLGLKNALGFGCIEDIKSKEEKTIYRVY